MHTLPPDLIAIDSGSGSNTLEFLWRRSSSATLNLCLLMELGLGLLLFSGDLEFFLSNRDLDFFGVLQDLELFLGVFDLEFLLVERDL